MPAWLDHTSVKFFSSLFMGLQSEQRRTKAQSILSLTASSPQLNGIHARSLAKQKKLQGKPGHLFGRSVFYHSHLKELYCCPGIVCLRILPSGHSCTWQICETSYIKLHPGPPLSCWLPYSADLFCLFWCLYLSAMFHNRSKDMKKYERKTSWQFAICDPTVGQNDTIHMLQIEMYHVLD